MEANYIEQFHVCQLWNRVNISWTDIHKDVNILVGINGSGKTTLLNLINDYYNGLRPRKGLVKSVKGTSVVSPVTYIRSFDIPANGKKRTESMLLQSLKYIINQNGEGSSLFDYRMRIMNYPEQSELIKERIGNFFSLIDSLFCETGKEVGFHPKTNTLVFYFHGRKPVETPDIHDSEEFVSVEKLSSGEKQLLLLLTTVFLQEEKPNILLLDEPEISLHITWQDKLISILRQLNPNCQLILTTHSPNIFADGWEDRIVFMEDIERRAEDVYC